MLASPISANNLSSKNSISFGRHHYRPKTYSEEDRRAMDDLVARTSSDSSAFSLDHIQKFIEHMTVLEWVLAGVALFTVYQIGKAAINKMRNRGQ